MFTGIVESTARVASLQLHEGTGRLVLDHVNFASQFTLGESVAVNGCCLTVVEFSSDTCSFDLLGETLRLTNLGALQSGDSVNLERAMRADARFSGHFVQGHIDTTAPVLSYDAIGQDHRLIISLPPHFQSSVIPKGSICVDGMSLTIAELTTDSFTIWITPHTHQVTSLQGLKPNWCVNLEFDMLAKYVGRILDAR